MPGLSSSAASFGVPIDALTTGGRKRNRSGGHGRGGGAGAKRNRNEDQDLEGAEKGVGSCLKKVGGV